MKKNIFSIIAIFNFTLYLSMKSIWSGIQGMFGTGVLQYIFLGIILSLFLTAIVFRFIDVKPVVVIVVMGVSIFLTIALFYMLYLGIDSYVYFVRSFIQISFYLLATYFVYLLIYKFPKCKLANNKLYKSILFMTIALFLVVELFGLDFHYITNQPVVYAVEDDYQIVWTTSTHSTAEVKIGDILYYDLYAGSERSETTVHKVVVPMSELDLEKSYTISTTNVLFRGPYSGILGRTITKTYDFKPVDLSDGLKYYTVADTHTQIKAAIDAASYYGDELDFLILNGDIVNHIESSVDAEKVLKLAFAITNGEKPVIYARGNHDVKGEYANQLHRYVGSVDEKFYYTFRLDNVYGVVLDLGEDHDDSWWEFYDTAHYDAYREEQTVFLDEVIASNEYNDPEIEYRLGICHIPVTLVEDEYLDDILNDLTTRLNLLNLDAFISGHKHQLLAFTPDIPALIDFNYHENYRIDTEAGYRTDANFTNFIVARRSLSQDVSIKENLFGRVFTGLATEVDFTTNKATYTYTNSLKEIVPVVDPYSGIIYQNYVFDLS